MLQRDYMGAIEMSVQDQRQQLGEDIKQHNVAPLWDVLDTLVTPEPKDGGVPTIWPYEDIRPAIMRAGELITAKEAVRRVLILKNPGFGGRSQATSSLFAGLQLILPGEVAPLHRHTQSALRFIVEGNGAYTSVDGERTTMYEGDFVITPTWTWHDHGNLSDKPVVWLDGLDVPLIKCPNVSFAEDAEMDSQAVSRPEGDALARYGSGLLPVDHQPTQVTSPVFNYPYSRTREALEQLRRSDAWDPCHGLKLKYVNPVTGDYAMATIGTFMQLLPKGFETAPYRCTDATVFSVVEGSGHTVVGDSVLNWQARDTFVVPGWQLHHHVSAADAVLFSFSDRPVQVKTGLWREDRGNH
jgi:gentisate 1,2-dioxygenase